MNAAAPNCQGCGAVLTRSLVDLGCMPLANSFVAMDAIEPDPSYPLHARICDRCLLIQVEPVVSPQAIFGEYAYFSSFSESWLAHCRAYVSMTIDRFALTPESRVVEIASNDGYLLTNFVAAGIPCLGIEPAANVAAAARARGVPTEVAFFGSATATRLAADYAADLIVAKNVLAHVPDINDFVSGVRILLREQGVFTVEFPHVLNLIREVQFDTIYHEHFTYLSLFAVERILARHRLRVFDVEEVSTHGGSLRLYICHDSSQWQTLPSVSATRAKETVAKLDRPDGYEGFGSRVARVRSGLLAFLEMARARGSKVAAYGAAAKGNTLLNYCGVGRDRIVFVADRNPAKQGRLLPGSRIPVLGPDAIVAEKPDYVLILPWNLKDEISEQNSSVRAWNGKFVTAIPGIRVI